MTNLVEFNKLPWIDVDTGIRVKKYENGDKIITMIELTFGFEEKGWCTKSHTNYILEGEFKADFDGRIETYKAGDILYIPKGMKHKALIGNTQKVIMIDF